MAPPAPRSNAKPYTRVPDPIDSWLEKLGFCRKIVPKDGSCLFRAVAEQVYMAQARHERVRQECIEFMEKNQEKLEEFIEGPYDHHLFELKDTKTWGGQVEMQAMSLLYKHDFLVFQDVGAQPYHATDNGFEKVIRVCYMQRNHYDIVYAIQQMESLGLCQGLVYGALYKNVFNMPDADVLADKMLYEDPVSGKDGVASQDERLISDSPSPELVVDAAQKENGDNKAEADIKPAPERIYKKFSYKVAKALSTRTYRNVEVDTWFEQKNEGGGMRPRPHSFAPVKLEVGGKCIYRPTDRPNDVFYGHIQKLENGFADVYVERMGEKKHISCKELEALPPSKPVYKNYKQLSGYHEKAAPMIPEYAGRGGRKPRMPKSKKPGNVIVAYSIGHNTQGMLPPRLPMQYESFRGRGRGGFQRHMGPPKYRFPTPNAVPNMRMNSHPNRLNTPPPFRPSNSNDALHLAQKGTVNGSNATSPPGNAGHSMWGNRDAILNTSTVPSIPVKGAPVDIQSNAASDLPPAPTVPITVPPPPLMGIPVGEHSTTSGFHVNRPDSQVSNTSSPGVQLPTSSPVPYPPPNLPLIPMVGPPSYGYGVPYQMYGSGSIPPMNWVGQRHHDAGDGPPADVPNSGMQLMYNVGYDVAPMMQQNWNYQTQMYGQGSVLSEQSSIDKSHSTSQENIENGNSSSPSSAVPTPVQSNDNTVAALTDNLQQNLVLSDAANPYYHVQPQHMCYYPMVPDSVYLPHDPTAVDYQPVVDEMSASQIRDGPRGQNQRLGTHLPPRFQKNHSSSHYARQRYQYEGQPLLQMNSRKSSSENLSPYVPPPMHPYGHMYQMTNDGNYTVVQVMPQYMGHPHALAPFTPQASSCMEPTVPQTQPTHPVEGNCSPGYTIYNPMTVSTQPGLFAHQAATKSWLPHNASVPAPSSYNYPPHSTQ